MRYSEEINKIRLKAGTKKIVFVSGNFNILHPGHIRLLRFAKECADFLVVGVFADAVAKGAILDEESRYDSVSSNSIINHSLILDTPAAAFIQELRPDFVVKGREHESSNNPESDIIKNYNGKLIFSSGESTFSSLDLLRQEFSQNHLPHFKVASSYLKRHNADLDSLENIIDSFSDLNVAVIGDVIVDEYINCDPIGMSQEEPTIVVRPVDTTKYLGGAGIVASHAAGLGAKVSFLSVTGDDDAHNYIHKTLEKYRVKPILIKDISRKTSTKQRYRASGKSLLRINHLNQHTINKCIKKTIIKNLKNLAPELDLLVFSDFNYGVLPQELVEEISIICKEHSVKMVADSQSSSQVGDVSRFKDMLLITPTEREARLASHDQDSGLIILAEKLKSKSNSENIILTLGAEGLVVHADKKNDKSWMTDKLPAFCNNPVDVAGAGDSLLISSSLALCSKASIWEAALIGAIAASCQVSKVGNRPLNKEEIINQLRTIIRK